MIRVVESRKVTERRWLLARWRTNTICRDPALSRILSVCTRLVGEHGTSSPDDLGGIHPGGCVDGDGPQRSRASYHIRTEDSLDELLSQMISDMVGGFRVKSRSALEPVGLVPTNNTQEVQDRTCQSSDGDRQYPLYCVAPTRLLSGCANRM
jgi:hypothetical protein